MDIFARETKYVTYWGTDINTEEKVGDLVNQPEDIEKI